MTVNEPSARLSPADIDALFNAPLARARRRIAAEPETYLIVTPGTDQLTLQTTAVTTAAPDVTSLRHIGYELVKNPAGGNWHELTVHALEDRFASYQVLAVIAELLRSGVKFHDAVPVAVGALREILARRTKLSEEQQIGLFGELLVLEHGLATASEETLEAWLGIENEEHDFVFRDFDLEVKTTRSEGRVHTINSLTQLEAAPSRPLSLVSIQLTGGGSAAEGRSLTDIVADIRRATDERWHRGIDEKLAKAGWHDEDADLYPTRWLYRSRPRAYQVDDLFPALTPSTVVENVPSPQLIVSVRYQVDVTQLPFFSLSHPVQEFAEEVQ
ncbi:PD-(D/E)XK motif protein [Salinibacterium sp. NG253]|uniref:PD-(D/E)XK motif protein n=1 Tax=Salinibacterium sp. NG253 TaxID=2792039 RepID=UPI0018CF62B3|nr:PD-(D/E)XK motif protein [Salinibacterium sp. NG253]MBH0116996.1 PD-(D/E)XK motif protein [Salinibacterium sp. NG253]